MKFAVLICGLALVGYSVAESDTESLTPHSRGCIYIMGRCVRDCEEGTHAYALGCGHRMPEATCDEPNPVEERAILCDYSACYCDPPTVRDQVNDKCVPLDQCPGHVKSPST